jgi:hypothetical protein
VPQRSPLVVGLLLIATLAVDLVAGRWYSVAMMPVFFRDSPMLANASQTLYYALIYSQLSIVCIWAAFAGPRGIWRWLLPFVFAWGAAEWTAHLTRYWRLDAAAWRSGIPAAFAYFAIHVIVLSGAVWILRQTRFGRERLAGTDAGPWRFSLLQLLFLMTATAITLTYLNNVGLQTRLSIGIVLATMHPVGIAIVALIALHLRQPMLARLAILFGTSLLFGVVRIQLTSVPPLDVLASSIIQAAVLTIWIQLAPIVPASSNTHAADAAAEQ